MRVSLAESDANRNLSDHSSGGDDIISAVMDSFEAVLAQVRASAPKPKQPSREAQSDNLLHATLLDIEKAIHSLEPARIASLHPDRQWEAVDKAAEEVAMSAKVLQAFDDGAEEKTFVVQQLRTLENLVGRLRQDLPPDKRPYYYDCGTSLR